MPKALPPDFKEYIDKKLSLKLNSGRQIVGILREIDPFMNLVVDETIEEYTDGHSNYIGLVVVQVNSIVMFHALDNVN